MGCHGASYKRALAVSKAHLVVLWGSILLYEGGENEILVLLDQASAIAQLAATSRRRALANDREFQAVRWLVIQQLLRTSFSGSAAVWFEGLGLSYALHVERGPSFKISGEASGRSQQPPQTINSGYSPRA